MDSESVISLSSTSSKASPSKSGSSSKSIVSVSSESQRIPVSWDSDKKLDEVIFSCGAAISDLEKVKEWMNSCKNSKECEEDNNTNKKTTCIRYDFDKGTRTTSLPKSWYTRTTPLFSYMEEAKKNSLNNNNNNKYTKAKSPEHHRLNGNHKHNGDYDTPLSPESQKKELCSYLQLMKPSENKQEVPLRDQRRSNRVKIQKSANEKKKLIEQTGEKDSGKKRESLEEFHKNMDVMNFPTLKSAKELNLKVERLDRHIKLKRKEAPNKYMPLPAKKVYEETEDFEECMKEIIKETRKTNKKYVNGCMKKVENRRKFKLNLKRPQQKFKKTKFSLKRMHSLRSKGYLRNITLDTLILRKSQMRRKVLQQRRLIKEIKEKTPEKELAENQEEKTHEKEIPKKSEKIESPRCEIISVHVTSDDENIDLKNFVDDMLELDKMSEEHRKNVIESRILTSSSITNLINKQTTKEENVQKAYRIFSELSNEKKYYEEKENSSHEKENDFEEKENNSNDKENNEEVEDKCEENENTHDSVMATNVVTLIFSEHDYADLTSKYKNTHTCEDEEEEEEDDDDDDEEESVEDEECLSPVPIPDLQVLPVNKDIEIKSLHRSLALANKPKLYSNSYGLHNWNSGSNTDSKKLNHSISISKKNGRVLQAFYQDYNLVVIQENSVSFWTQSALGNVLGAQNMWIPKGQSQRIPLNSTYIQKKAMEMVISTETSVAYVELWTKEHKSDVREVPVADVFATVYFWRLRQNGLDKKALQLENIKGFTDDVQYCVLKCYPRIIVSWHSVQGNEKKTKIHSYHLAADFQTVANISEIQPVEHYVASLHNIEDCDNLVMGCGDNKITLWNVEYGYIVATIELSSIKSPLSTLWVKCDRGFLFTIQECVDRELRLIAINGMNHSWKKLQNYNPLQGFESVKGVCIENGILVAYYSQGILCWNAQTGELIVEEVPNECEYIPSGKHVIMIVNDKIIVRHSLSHLINADEF